MKKLLFTIAILLIAGIVKGYGDCVRNALGEFSYENRFIQLQGHSGLYATKVKRPTAYDQCGDVVTFRDRDTIYVRDDGSFWKGSYRGKSGVWAQTIIDFDGPGGRQFGTFVYVLMKDLSYIKEKKVVHIVKRKVPIKNKVDNVEKPLQVDYLSVFALLVGAIILFNWRAGKHRKYQTDGPILPQMRTRPVLRTVPPRAPTWLVPPVAKPEPLVSPVAKSKSTIAPVAKSQASIPPVAKSKPVDKPKPPVNKKAPPVKRETGAYTFPWDYTGNESIYPKTTYSSYSPTPPTPKEETKPQPNTWDHGAFMDSVFADIQRRQKIEENERKIEEKERSGKSSGISDIEWLKIENDRLR